MIQDLILALAFLALMIAPAFSALRPAADADLEVPAPRRRPRHAMAYATAPQI